MEEKQAGTAGTVHTPVLLQQVIDSLAVRPTDTVVDGTAGGGGHAHALLSALGPTGRYVAIDADRVALTRVQAKVGDDPRLTLVHGNFRDIDGHLASVGIDAFDKLLLDLGLSSDQLETSVRGFSFTKDEPLIMTLSDSPREGATTAWHVVNDWSEQSLADVIYGFGGERFARKIAHAIVLRREGHPIETTKELADVVASTYVVRGAFIRRRARFKQYVSPLMMSSVRWRRCYRRRSHACVRVDVSLLYLFTVSKTES